MDPKETPTRKHGGDMSRTEELRHQGATDRTAGAGGFVKWPKSDTYAWIEGEVRQVWESEYGPAVTLLVRDCEEIVLGGGNTPEPGTPVNIGLNYVSLQNAVKDDDVGRVLHFAFEGWGETQAGEAFRRFAVLEVPADHGPSDDAIPF